MSGASDELMDMVDARALELKRAGRIQHFSIVLMEPDGDVVFQSCCERAEHTFLSSGLRAHGQHSRIAGMASPKPGEAGTYD